MEQNGKNKIYEFFSKLYGKQKRIVIYTAITGKYDVLKNPTFLSENYDYICFSDDPSLKSDVWKIKKFDEYDRDNIRKCRRVKILPHLFFQEYAYSIWMDANISLKGSPEELIHTYLKKEKLATFIHPDRDCIYDEAFVCGAMNKNSKEIIDQQMEQYKKEGYPFHHGLIASGVILRKHNDRKVIKAMEGWWHEIERFSRRDQLSFNYVAWKNNFRFEAIHKNIWKNDLVEVISHALQ